jgi:hypothetical protein
MLNASVTTERHRSVSVHEHHDQMARQRDAYEAALEGLRGQVRKFEASGAVNATEALEATRASYDGQLFDKETVTRLHWLLLIAEQGGFHRRRRRRCFCHIDLSSTISRNFF